jgi:fumarate reductase subunit C
MSHSIGMLVSCLLLWASVFIQWHMIGLCLGGGRVLVTEARAWVRWLELGLNSVIIFIALTAVFYFWYKVIQGGC